MPGIRLLRLARHRCDPRETPCRRQCEALRQVRRAKEQISTFVLRELSDSKKSYSMSLSVVTTPILITEGSQVLLRIAAVIIGIV